MLRFDALESSANAGMDAVFSPVPRLWMDGSQFAGDLLAVLRRVGFMALACETVAICLGYSRVGGSALLLSVASRLKALFLRLLLQLLLVAVAASTPDAEACESLAC